MHPKMVIGYTGYEKGTIAIPFPEAINTFRLKNVPKLCSMPLYDIRGKLYVIRNVRLYVIRGTLVYDNTLQ